MAATRRPALVAVDNIVVAIEHRAGLEVGERGAGVRLGHRDRYHFFALDHLRKDLRLHLGRAEAFDGAHRPGQRLEHREGDRVGNPREFLEHDQRLKMPEAEPAIFGRQVHPEKAHLAINAQHVVRDGIVLGLHVARQRGQFGTGKFARGVLQLALLVGQLKVHASINPLSSRPRPLAHL